MCHTAVLADTGHYCVFSLYIFYKLRQLCSIMYLVWAHLVVQSVHIYPVASISDRRRPNGPVFYPLFEGLFYSYDVDKNKIVFAAWTHSPHQTQESCHMDSFYPSNPQLVSISSSPVPNVLYYLYMHMLCVFRSTLLCTFLKKTHSEWLLVPKYTYCISYLVVSPWGPLWALAVCSQYFSLFL